MSDKSSEISEFISRKERSVFVVNIDKKHSLMLVVEKNNQDTKRDASYPDAAYVSTYAKILSEAGYTLLGFCAANKSQSKNFWVVRDVWSATAANALVLLACILWQFVRIAPALPLDPSMKSLLERYSKDPGSTEVTENSIVYSGKSLRDIDASSDVIEITESSDADLSLLSNSIVAYIESVRDSIFAHSLHVRTQMESHDTNSFAPINIHDVINGISSTR